MQLDTLDRPNADSIASSALGQMGHTGQSPSLVRLTIPSRVMVTIPTRPMPPRQASSSGARPVAHRLSASLLCRNQDWPSALPNDLSRRFPYIPYFPWAHPDIPTATKKMPHVTVRR